MLGMREIKADPSSQKYEMESQNDDFKKSKC